ncbi:phosphotriesterase-related protein [Novosphingobium sp. PC22D]|uniref:phosphotriesterase family protein n=1 Tax=Novosphingobium sp. PC22D TaxID=1962403 RepID=UPI000BF12A8F|nr:phosphotriesterase [Novosphingobium sp. PC22D]PEQ13086.1 phosphotriesterase-related protein [Novosphingobium sp. PC22D]
MPKIETARGAIESADLGRVLIHEHVFLMDMEYTYNYRPDFFDERTISDAVARLDALHAAGIDTIIDLTVLGLGRHMPALAEAAGRTALNIVVSTGAYTFDAVPAPFLFWGPGLLKDAEVEPMIGHFIGDIVDGIAGTGVKAGMLKCAIDAAGLRPGVERVMRAVAQANRATGVPITVHTAPLQHTGRDVQRVLAEEGVDLEEVVIGHCGDSTDIDYLMELADKGSILGMDRFGVDFAITMDERVATIAEMVRRGYADRLALSHDCCCWSDFFPDVSDYAAAMPNHNYLHIHNDVIPALGEAGVSQHDLDRMFVETPRRLFERAATKAGVEA